MSTGIKKVIVICACPSAQMSAQYDAVSKSLNSYSFHILFRNASFDESSWPAVMPRYADWSILEKPRLSKALPKRIRWLINNSIEATLNKHGPDAVIVHGLYDNTAALQSIRWCLKNKVPYLLRSDGNVIKHDRLWRYPFKLVGRPLVKKAAAILYIGIQNRRYYELFEARQEQLFLAPWEIDYENLELMNKSSEMRGEIRRELNLSNQVVFLFLGRILKLKGLDTVIPVIKRLRLEGLPVRFLIVGDGPYLPVLKSKHNLADCEYIKCLGGVAREEVCKWYTCADAFVLSSYEEAWGLVVNEAALCGLPLVVSDQVGAGADLVVHGKNGFIYPAKDQNALYNYLRQLALDEMLRNEMGTESGQILKEWRETASAIKGYKKALDHVTKLGDRQNSQNRWVNG